MGLVLRGIFLGDDEWKKFFFEGEGLQAIFPDEWARFNAVIPLGEHDDVIGAYHRLLNHADLAVRHPAVQAWNRYEDMTSQVVLPLDYVCEPYSPTVEAIARIECYYFLNN